MTAHHAKKTFLGHSIMHLDRSVHNSGLVRNRKHSPYEIDLSRPSKIYRSEARQDVGGESDISVADSKKASLRIRPQSTIVINRIPKPSSELDYS
jgi:hypothetical protein